MNHVAKFILAAILFAFASVIVWYNRTALTTPILGSALGLIAFALFLSAKADFKEACATVAPFVPLVKKGGPS